ncbi:MAG: SusD/RagB family nutrient-binding outer membrane lipoprotein, partial [Mucilaginibacter sp.]
GSGTSQESPFYGSYGFDVNGNATGNNNYYRANATAVNFYNDNNDPRASRFYAPITGGGIQGNVFGDILHNNANPKTSAIGPGLLKGADQGAVLISASESDFLQAEAINQSLIPASSTKFASDQEAYQQGITDSFTDLGLTAAQATTYYSQNADNVGWGPSPNKLTAILTQKWAAMNGWFNLVAYNDYRRTGIPNLPSSVDPTAIGTNLPTRILYPTSELSTNTANVGKEGTINPLTSKIFWAQ